MRSHLIRMTKILSIVSHKNYNISANECFVIFLTSKLITCFIDSFTSKMKSQSIVYLLNERQHAYFKNGVSRNCASAMSFKTRANCLIENQHKSMKLWTRVVDALFNLYLCILFEHLQSKTCVHQVHMYTYYIHSVEMPIVS